MTGALCLTFDDQYVEDWVRGLDLLRPFGARATFYVSGFSNLKPDSVAALRQIQDDGHEIGLHSATHSDLRLLDSYLHRDQYLAMEVLPPLRHMRAQGFEVRSWSYPFNHGPPAYVEALDALFVSQRCRAETVEDALHPLGARHLRALSGDLVVRNTLHPDRSLDRLVQALDRAVDADACLVLYMHAIAESGAHAIPPKALLMLVRAAFVRGMAFLTTAEVASPGAETEADLATAVVPRDGGGGRPAK